MAERSEGGVKRGEDEWSGKEGQKEKKVEIDLMNVQIHDEVAGEKKRK